MFYTLTNLQGSQTKIKSKYSFVSFTLLLTYKVLKPVKPVPDGVDSFTLLLTYKVLKRITDIVTLKVVLHSY